MKLLLPAALLVATAANAVTISRAAIHLNGVTSNRGYFNVAIRLRQVDGIEWAKYDLSKSMITVDFAPGKSPTADELREACRSAGYKPGEIDLKTVEQPVTHDGKLGWRRMKQATARNPVARWFQLNF
jgi:copper chaperone CopZ